MGSEWAPLEGLTQTARQMGGGTDGQRHPRTQTERDRQMDWDRERRTDRGAGRKRSQKNWKDWERTRKAETWRQAG